MAWTKVDKNTFDWYETVSDTESFERSTSLGDNAITIGGDLGLFLNLSDNYFDRLDGYIIKTSWTHSSSGGTSWNSVTEATTDFDKV